MLPGLFFDDWPHRRNAGDRNAGMGGPYSDDMAIDDYYRGRQGHRQPIKTSGDPRQHPGAAQAQGRSGNSSSRPVRSAPVSPHGSTRHPYHQQQQQHPFFQQQQPHMHQQHQHHAPHSSSGRTPTPPGSPQPGRAATPPAAAGAAAAAGARPSPVRGTAAPARRPQKQLPPAAAATRIQAAWRGHRLSRHGAAVKQLGSCAERLRQLAVQLRDVQQAQPGIPLTQKQYLELSEAVMKVLFALDEVTCGSAVELRAKRKELTTRANKLLDEIQAAHKAKPNPAAAAAGKSSKPAAAAGAAPQQEDQQGRATRSKTKKGGLSWLRRS